MKTSNVKFYFLNIFLLVLVTIDTKAQQKDILQTIVNSNVIDEIVSNIDEWRIKKKNHWSQQLNNLPDSIKTKIIENGELYLSYEWPSHKAIEFLGYKLNGNRTVYESALIKRRGVFENLVNAELIERKGRFIPDIINGLWLILEESTWVSPAHLPTQKLGLGLPNIDDMYIDLGAGRQAVSVALTYFMLQDEFDKYSKHINIRILHELRRRIINPFIERTDYWWMGYHSGFVNNWNIWINTNVLKTFLLIESEKDKLKDGVKKVLSSADNFVNFYPEDGACDEGPSYWAHAGGELGSLLKWLMDASAESISFEDQIKLKNIGGYIINSRIAENRYVNFADAFAVENISPLKLWNYYLVFKDKDFGGFASYLAHRSEFVFYNQGLHDLLESSVIREDLYNHNTNFKAADFTFYESLGQVLVNNKAASNTLFFSAIGKHNGVSHNHNDVGSYVLYYNGQPVLIDIGVGTYNSKTFSDKRYEIWNMQSQYHNLPLINNAQQQAGNQYKATDVKASKSNKAYFYTANIANAYPEDADVESWIRDFSLNKKSNILEVTEKFVLRKFKASPKMVFMMHVKPSIHGDKVNLVLADGHKAVLSFKTKTKAINIEEIPLDDPRIMKVWGKKVYRVIAEVDSKLETGIIQYNFTFNK